MKENLMDVGAMIERYESRREAVYAKLAGLYDPAGPTKFIVRQYRLAQIFQDCNSVSRIVANNLAAFAIQLDVPSDDLPYLEPWIGTGVYANAFGSEYVWFEGEAPATRYRYQNLDEVRDLAYPDWRTSPVMGMVLSCIDALLEAGRGKLPLCLTDTQSAYDTATLILDATEFFTGCYIEPELVATFVKQVNDLILEFSGVQSRMIGDALLATPGHLMPSMPGIGGISVSDDNLAVSSPAINELFSFPANAACSAAFGGIAIHSCGRWAHTMRILDRIPGVSMIDCALSADCDPSWNEPEDLRDALVGKSIVLKVRIGSDVDRTVALLKRLFHPDLKLCVDIGYVEDKAAENYARVTRSLEELYAGEGAC